LDRIGDGLHDLIEQFLRQRVVHVLPFKDKFYRLVKRLDHGTIRVESRYITGRRINKKHQITLPARVKHQEHRYWLLLVRFPLGPARWWLAVGHRGRPSKHSSLWDLCEASDRQLKGHVHNRRFRWQPPRHRRFPIADLAWVRRSIDESPERELVWDYYVAGLTQAELHREYRLPTNKIRDLLREGAVSLKLEPRERPWPLTPHPVVNNDGHDPYFHGARPSLVTSGEDRKPLNFAPRTVAKPRDAREQSDATSLQIAASAAKRDASQIGPLIQEFRRLKRDGAYPCLSDAPRTTCFDLFWQ
jgi:hypothetical protein